MWEKKARIEKKRIETGNRNGKLGDKEEEKILAGFRENFRLN